MGFYGKVTNSSKTQFSFDRIYANRKEMDELCASDGVFVGRYVLIDYDEGNASFKRIYVKELDNGKKVAWATANLDEAIGELKKGNFTDGETVYEAQLLGDNTTQVIKKYYTIKFVGDSYELVDTEEPAESAVSNYVTNFNIDKDYITAKANNDKRAFGRGYDSTVWTKVFEKGQYKYVSVAELNSVVPTFDVTADAPTLSPITPHFDADSTNVYYKLHAQPTWGFRIKKATPELIYDVDPTTGEIGGEPISPEDSDLAEKMIEYDENKVPIFYRLNSDQTTVWKRKEYNKYPSKEDIENKEDPYTVDYYYNPHTDNWEKYDIDNEPEKPDANGELSADIYYNKDGFNKDYIYKSKLKDEIIIEPSGASGHIYAHDKTKNEETDPDKKKEKTKDIQELSIHLASIGNAISDMWDMVYGDASANRKHEGEEPAVKWVPQKINLTKRELDYYKTRSELTGSNGILKWVNKGFKPADIDKPGVYQDKVYDVSRNTTWSEDKEFYIFNKTPVRNTDIKWRDGLDTISSEPDYESHMSYEKYPPTQSMRLVHSDNNKTIGKEYTYNKDQVSTIAGTINAAHDLMGMIIHEVTDNEKIDDEYVNNSEENLIYYYPRYYGEGENKVPNEKIILGRDENGIPNRGITLKQVINKNNFEDANVDSAEDFIAGEMYLYDNNQDKYCLATKYEKNKTYYKLNTVDLLEFEEVKINSEDQFKDEKPYLYVQDQGKYCSAKSYEPGKIYYKLKTNGLQDRTIEPGQFYRKKVDYVYEEVPQAQYWNKDNVDSVLWEKAGDDGKLIQFNKNRLFNREIKHYLDSNGKLESFYKYILTNDDKALPDKSYYELITNNGTKILEQKYLKDVKDGGNLHFYKPYSLKDDEGYWTINKEDDKEDDKERIKVYTQETKPTITEVEKESKKNFYKFAPNVLVDKELYIPGAYVLKLKRKAIDPTKNDDIIRTVPTALFVSPTGAPERVHLDQLAKPSYTIGDDDDILDILFKYNKSYYTHDNNYEDVYTNLGLFPINWNSPTEKEIDLGNGITQIIKTYDTNDRFEAKWANDFYDPEDDRDNKYYLAEYEECRYSDFTKDKLDAINNTSKLNETLQKIKEINKINKVIKTIPESLIDIYIEEDAKDKKDAQELLEEFSTKKHFFNGPGEYVFKFEELRREEDEKFNALNLKRINGLQKVITINLDGGEGPVVDYIDITEEDLKEGLGLTLEQLSDGKEPVNALYPELAQNMSDINKRINRIIDLYNNGKNSNEINNYISYFDFDKYSYKIDDLFDKSIVGKGYYTERLKYINLPECEYTTNFYNSMAEKGNLFVLNEPKGLIEPIELSKYAANAFFIRRTKSFENPLDPTKPLMKVYWNLAGEARPKANENYYDLSNYLIPVKIGEKFDNKKDYYIKAQMPATEEFAWDDVEYYKINSIKGNYKVIPETKDDDNALLKKLNDESDNYYPNPKYFDKVIVTADVGTHLTMYKPGEYYRRNKNGEYELDITENGKESIYDGSYYYIWGKDDDYLKTAENFFIPYVYYYKKDGVYWPTYWENVYESPAYDKENGKDLTTYYKGKTYYVIKDDLGYYTPGAEWNPAVVPVPKSVHLGIRKEKYKWEKLEDFSRTYNTLNGLILRTNKLLEDGDSYTRDTSTIQGCINRIRDIIAKFEATVPGNLMVVDGYGRIRGSEYSTDQSDKITNYGKQLNGTLGTNIPIESEYLNYTEKNGEHHGRWIDLQVFNYSFNGKDYVDLEAAKKLAGKFTFIGDPSNEENNNNDDSNKENYEQVDINSAEQFIYGEMYLYDIDQDKYYLATEYEENKTYYKLKTKDKQYKYYYHWENLNEEAFNQDKKSFYIVDKNNRTIIKNNDAAYDSNKRNNYYKLIEFENKYDARVKYEQNNKLEITDEHAVHELEHYVFKFKPKIKVAHNFINSEIKPEDTTTNSNLNWDIPTENESAVNKKSGNSNDNEELGNNIILYSPIVDDMGHIVAHNQETVTLPYGFKYLEAKNNVTENGLDSDIYSNSVTNTENQNVSDTKDKDSDKLTYTRAKKTQDTLLFEAKNKWLQVQLTPKDLDNQEKKSIGGSAKDTLTIAHEVHSIDRTAKSTNPNVADGIIPNDTITVQDLEFDNAGHVTENHKHTYTLPYSYKHITTSHSESVNSITQNTNTTTADNTQDKVEFAMGNKWLESKVENDKVTFAHETHWAAANDATDKDNLSGFTRNAKTSFTTTDLNGLETFTTEHYTFDNAGHVNSHNTHTYEMPHGYSYLLTKGTSTSVDFVTGNDSALGAMKTKDNVEFVAGNRWLTISGSDSNADGVNDTITFRHAPAGTAVTLKGDSENQTPDYGATFKVPYVTIDEAGHVKTLTDHTVTMPKQNIIGTGNVVTKADHDTGNTLTFTHEQLMNLKLSTSSTVETLAVTKSANPDQHTSHTAITSANTLREAFGAIPTMIDERVEDILGTATTDTLDTLTEISAWINANGADLNKYVNLVTLEKDFYGLDSNGNVLSYNGTNSLMNRTSTLETAKNNIYTMLGDVDHYALNGHYSLDHSAERDPNKIYYTFSNGQYVEILLTDSMYEPSKYYIKDVTVEDRIKGLESQVDHYVTDDLKQKVDAAWDLLQTVQQTTGNVPADPDTMTPTASVDGYMKYHVGRTAPTDTEGNPITNAMWIDTSNMQNILVKFPVYNYNAETGKNVLSWISINTWQ